MTDEEALGHLTAECCFGYIDWEGDGPAWVKRGSREAMIVLNGKFTVLELLAIIHFAPENKK